MKRAPAALLAALLVTGALSGCATKQIRATESPEPLPLLAASYTVAQKDQDVAAYNSKIAAKDLAGARVMRDIIVQSIRREIEVVYQAFERNLFANKAAFDVESDIFELVLSTSATLTGAQRASKNLTALLTGAKGARLSVDKNVFGEKTYSALVSQMRASRSKISADITTKLAKLDVVQYPLAEAEVDLVHLFNAGTIHEALIDLSTRAGAAAEQAAKTEAAAEKLRLEPATQQQVDQITAIRSRFNELFANEDVADAKAILKTLDPTVPDDLADADVWKRLDQQIRKATDKTYLPTVAKAFGVSN